MDESRLLEESQLVQAQKLESIGQLAAGVAHEINTPIQYVGDNFRFVSDSFLEIDRVLAQYARLLESVKGTESLSNLVAEVEQTIADADLAYLLEEIPQAIRQCNEGIERVAHIVKAMKEFSHPGSHRMKPVDLNYAIESTLTVCRNEWKYVAEMVTDLDPALPPVRCLAGELKQVILNLVINAAHAIAEAKKTDSLGRILVSTRQNGEAVEIRVGDNGVGIPAAIQSRIFDPFFTTKEVGKGTGQGLAIARNVVVKKHAGTLSFETQEGNGTTFLIQIPINGKQTREYTAEEILANA
jgi:two-component system, NtrC family, sensor kinase